MSTSRPFDEWMTDQCKSHIDPEARAVAERLVRAGYLFTKATRARWKFWRDLGPDTQRQVRVNIRWMGGRRSIERIDVWDSTRTLTARRSADIDAWLTSEEAGR